MKNLNEIQQMLCEGYAYTDTDGNDIVIAGEGSYDDDAFDFAGLALLGTLGHSLHQALQPDLDREAAIITFLVTASGVTGFGIGSAFWGLLAGGLALALRADRLQRWLRRAQDRA